MPHQTLLGDKWSGSSELKLPMLGMDYKSETEYELLGLEKLNGRNCAKIRVTEKSATIPLNKSPDAGPFAGMQMTMSLSDGKGLMWWDLDKGYVVRMRQTQGIEINITTKVEGDDSPVAVAVKQKLHNAVSVDVIEPTAKTK